MEFKAMLKTLSGEVIRTKDQYRLFNTTVFDEPKPGDAHVRGLAQALYSHLMILDIDDGDLSPWEFIEIMSPYRVAFSICNSFSRTPDKHNKFRVFIYLKSPVDDYDYKRIWDSIVRIFASAGYYTDEHSLAKKRKETWPAYQRTGIDRTKRHIASFYYPPCINIEHRDMAFFESHNCDRARDMAKHALDPVKWLEQHPEPTPLAPIEFEEEVLEEIAHPTSSHLTVQERIDRAIADYNSLTEGRHYGGYRLVLRILAADPDERNLRRHLERARCFNYQKLPGRVSDAKKWLARLRPCL
jgi:hypothetical protein